MKRNKLFILVLMILCLTKLEIVHAENIYKEYKIGDKITYNDMDFYVIENSDSKSDRVTMLKAEPLSVDEVNEYGGVGTTSNHVNMNITKDTSSTYFQRAYNQKGYGGMQYYSSSTCWSDETGWEDDGCTTQYDKSEVKYIVDAWALDKFSKIALTEDRMGYKARLLTFEELTNNLGYVIEDGSSYMDLNSENTPSWVYNSNYWYWTMSAYEDFSYRVWYVSDTGGVGSGGYVYRDKQNVVRPVVTLNKEPIEIKKLTDKEFKIGDIVEYNNMLFYVIKDSTEKDNSVTLLKSEPLSVDEVNRYGGVGTDNNHVNMYKQPTSSSYQTASDHNGYGEMAYYSSLTCGYDGLSWVYDECTTDYAQSEVKYVVDAWAIDNINTSDLTEDSLGYKNRLITYDELVSNLGYDTNKTSAGLGTDLLVTENVPSWVYNSNYAYWTMSPLDDFDSHLWFVNYNGEVNSISLRNSGFVVRPVITLKKITENSSENIEIEKEEEDKDIKNEVTENNKKPNQIVSVPDTLLKKPFIFVVLGVILIAISTTIYILIRRKNKNKKK